MKALYVGKRLHGLCLHSGRPHDGETAMDDHKVTLDQVEGINGSVLCLRCALQAISSGKTFALQKQVTDDINAVFLSHSITRKMWTETDACEAFLLVLTESKFGEHYL